MARGWVEGGRWSDIMVVLNLSFIVSYDSLPPPVSCEISDFIEYKNRKLGSLVFTFDSKIKKKKKKKLDPIHRSGFNENDPHTFSQMKQN